MNKINLNVYYPQSNPTSNKNSPFSFNRWSHIRLTASLELVRHFWYSIIKNTSDTLLCIHSTYVNLSNRRSFSLWACMCFFIRFKHLIFESGSQHINWSVLQNHFSSLYVTYFRPIDRFHRIFDTIFIHSEFRFILFQPIFFGMISGFINFIDNNWRSVNNL